MISRATGATRVTKRTPTPGAAGKPVSPRHWGLGNRQTAQLLRMPNRETAPTSRLGSGPLATGKNEKSANDSAARWVRALRPLGSAERNRAIQGVISENRLNVHQGPVGHSVASAAGVHGLTSGRNVYFANSFNPYTDAGLWLMGHEFAHARQQAAAHTPSVQHYGDTIPTVANPTAKTMEQFIDLVARVEDANAGKSAIEISQLVMRTKYHTSGWDFLLPSSAGNKGVTEKGQVSKDDVTTLTGEFEVQVPGGGAEDASHVVAAITANAEKQAPGSGGGPIAALVQSPPAGVTQRDIATWTGDVASAAANWAVARPVHGGGTTQQSYMDEYSPESDMIGDIDGVALGSTKAANGFVFNPAQRLSENLRRFYLPAKAREGRYRRFHAFCDVEGFGLEADGITLAAPAAAVIESKVEKNTDWFTKNDPDILTWVSLQANGFEALFNPIIKEWSKRKDDWKWFAQKFKVFVQKNLLAEGK